jgi:hypothetical protein
MFLRHHPWCVRQTVTDPREDQPVIPPEALTTPYWLQQKQRQQISLRQSPAPGAESHFTSAIMASIRRGKSRIGGRTHTLHLRIRNMKGVYRLTLFYTSNLIRNHPFAPCAERRKLGEDIKRVPHPCLRGLCEDRVGILTPFPPPGAGRPPKSSPVLPCPPLVTSPSHVLTCAVASNPPHKATQTNVIPSHALKGFRP